MVRLVKHVRERSSRPNQWRLLLLVLPLGLVLVLMAELRDPETADRINRVFSAVEQPPAAADVKTKLGLFPGVQRAWLGAIEDNTYFRNAEKDAWFHCFGILQRASAPQIESAQSVEADYVQLIDQPDYYRGKLVTIDGSVRQVTEQKPAANDLGLESYYRVVVQPTDGMSWPIFVYSLEQPPELLSGGELAGRVKVCGLFFKNLSYRAEEGMGTAPVILSKRIAYYPAAPGESPDRVRRPDAGDGPPSVGTDEGASDGSAGARAPRASMAFRDVLQLAGWDVQRLAMFDDGESLAQSQRVAALELLRRLRSFDSGSLEDWAQVGLDPYQMLTDVDAHRGQLVRLAGRITRVITQTLDSVDAERLEMPKYFECELELDHDAGTATVLTTRVPRAWLTVEALDEPASAVALYFKRISNDDPPRAVWVAKEIEWHPTTPNGPRVSLGASLLGNHGMDVGLLDQVEGRGPIRSGERDPFYRMLAAAGRMEREQLVRLAQEDLPAVRNAWQHEAEAAKSASRRRLANEVVERAATNRYSVAPLFNDPQSQVGRLIVVDGVARRAVRVEVGAALECGGGGETARRFGFDHYYEMEVFTDDSQNYPLVFCVHELPDGFPSGGSVHVPVRVAGFFFKDWLYRTRGGGDADTGDGRAQYAPLLVGRGPLVLAIGDNGRGVEFALGGLFVAALAAIWAVAVWQSREDRRFRARTAAAHYSLPTNQSLNELNLAAANEPMKE